MGTNANVLGQQDLPRFFRVDQPGGLVAPPPRRDVAVRVIGRSLAGMQKEALVVSSAAPYGWRLVSDEGPYLNGYDEAPFPLAFLSAGMAASYVTELLALSDQAGQHLPGLALTLHNRYTMEGSAVRGTMVGGALPPEVLVEVEDPPDGLERLVADTLAASPCNGLLRGRHTSRFTLTCDGEALALGRAMPLPGPPEPDPAALFTALSVDGPDAPQELMRRTRDAEAREGVEGGKGSSLAATQRRTLHVQADVRLRDDGMKQIDVTLHAPIGSTFRFLSDEPRPGSPGRGPDAATLMAAGIAFCFMTQLGRYATITRAPLESYRIVQDLHLSAGGASGRTGRAGQADSVETHVHLDARGDAELARRLVDMGEQTCFLHALCRTPLEPTFAVAQG